jgi:hypothetical protein
MDLSKETELYENANRIEAPLYNFNMNIVLDKQELEAVVARQWDERNNFLVESPKSIHTKTEPANRIIKNQGNTSNPESSS